MKHIHTTFESFSVNEGIKSTLVRGALDLSRLLQFIKKLFKGNFKDALEIFSEENSKTYGRLKKLLSFFLDNKELMNNYDNLFDEAKRNYNGSMKDLFNDMYGGNIGKDCDDVLKTLKDDIDKNKSKYNVQQRLKAKELLSALEEIKETFS
jgi:hypothetical protein